MSPTRHINAFAITAVALALGLWLPVTRPIGPEPAAAQTTAGVVLKELGREYLAYPDVKGTVQFSNCWGGARIPLVQQWIKDFTAIYRNVKVENDVSDCPSLDKKQVAAIAGGAPPNVLMVKSGNLAFFADQAALLPVDELMQRDRVRPDWFYPGELRSRTWQGKTYGLPNVTAGAQHLLFVNTKLLERVGWPAGKPIETWQDLEALVEPAKKQGLFVMDPVKSAAGLPIHFVLTHANGGRYWNDDLTKVLWTDAPAVEAAEWLLRFVKAQAGKYENLALGSNRKELAYPEEWAPEKYVATFNGSWFPFMLKSKAPQIRYAVYPFPRNAARPESKGHTASTGGWMFAIARAARDHAAAWEWIKFTAASQHACAFLRAQNRPAPIAQCNEDPELARANPFWPAITRDLATNVAVPTAPVHPRMVQLWYEMEDAFLFERMSPREALESFARRGQALLDEWNAKRKR
jgi:ABC-type glycerol-3-phosphate transport system substrate-binding protein